MRRQSGTSTPPRGKRAWGAAHGRNELLAMDACRLIANAEELYHQGAHQYTDTIISTPGKQDGLSREVAQDQAPSPLGKVNEFAKGVSPPCARKRRYSMDTLSAFCLRRVGSPYGQPMNRRSGVGASLFWAGKAFSISGFGPRHRDVASITSYNPTSGWAQAE